MTTCPPHRWFIRTLAPTEDHVTYEAWSCEKCGSAQTRPRWEPKRGWGPAERAVMNGESDE